MQEAIQTKILPATNTQPTRIKAWCARGSLTIAPSYDNQPDNCENQHTKAASDLCRKFCDEDYAQYGSPHASNPWAQPFVTGCLPNGDFCHVFK